MNNYFEQEINILKIEKIIPRINKLGLEFINYLNNTLKNV